LNNVYLMMIGGGSKPIEIEIREAVVGLNLGGRVRFIGMVPYYELPSYLMMCDAFITASVTEVHPLSVIEGMACGLPVLGIDSPGVTDTIDDGKTGLLSKNDLAAFTAKLTRLCMDSTLRQQLGTSARQASTQYAIEHTTSIMAKQYERLVYASRPRRESWSIRLRGFLEKHLR